MFLLKFFCLLGFQSQFEFILVALFGLQFMI